MLCYIFIFYTVYQGQSLPSYADIFAHESPDISLNISTDIVTLGDTDLSTYLLPPTWALALCSGTAKLGSMMNLVDVEIKKFFH